MKEQLKRFEQIAIAGIILALLVGVAFVVVNVHNTTGNLYVKAELKQEKAVEQ